MAVDKGAKSSTDKASTPTKKSDTLKLKRPKQKITPSSSWRGTSLSREDDNKSGISKSHVPSNTVSPGSAANRTDDGSKVASTPVDNQMDTAVCKHCKKFFPTSTIKSHVVGCVAARKEAARKKKEAKEAKEAKARQKEDTAAASDEEQSVIVMSAKSKDKVSKGKVKKVEKSAAVVLEDEDADGDDADDIPLAVVQTAVKPPTGLKSTKKSAGKKRKADDDPNGGVKVKKQKKKEELKSKGVKPKGPVDVERHMGAKRAVPGRSLPYDMLLSAYQKKNQAKQQKAAIDANAPLDDSDDGAAGPVDSDEETGAIMIALAHWAPASAPLIPTVPLAPQRRRYQLARLREQLSNATSGGTINIFGVGFKNGIPVPAAVGDVDADADADADAEADEDDETHLNAAKLDGLEAAAAAIAQTQQSAARRQSGYGTVVLPPQRKISLTVRA